MAEETIEENKNEAPEEETPVNASSGAMAAATTQSETIEMESGEDEDSGFDLFDIIILSVTILGDVIGYATGALNLTGIWMVVEFIIALVFLLFIALLKMAKYGLSFKAIFSTWGAVIALVLEFFPVVGNFLPLKVVYFFLDRRGRKKAKAKPKLKIEPTKQRSPSSQYSTAI